MASRDPRPLALLLALVAGLGACARRTDARVRAAWGGGGQAPGAATPGDGRTGEGNGSDAATEPVLQGWARVDQLLDTAMAEAALGTDDEVFARLAERWCETSPEPQRTEEGPVLVCLPDPPLQIDGHGFSLELGGEGVIGLVAAELSAETSTALVAEALDRLDRWCTRQWTDVTPRPTAPKASPPPTELYTCPVEGTVLLVVARFVARSDDQWRVSMTVIDAS